MKNFFETFLTALMLMMIVLITTMVVALQSTLVSARQIHNNCWNAVETSELYTEQDVTKLENKLNEAIHEKHSSWNVSIETLTNSNLRPYYLVTLDYVIQIPLINVNVDSKLQSYAQ